MYIELPQGLLADVRSELAKIGSGNAIMLTDKLDNLLLGETNKVRIVEGEIVETPKPNEIYLALFDYGCGWQVSGVFYHKPDDAIKNLAAFNLRRTLIIKVEMPENWTEGER